MKQKVLFACVALLMSSCSMKTYYQVVDVKSTNLQKESNNYVYNDGVCKIVYDFWSEGGDPGFTIENLSDEVLYIDLENTFFVENGLANDYYKARNYGVGKTIGKSVSKSAGISTGLSAMATAYGIWKGGTLNGYPGSVSAQASSVASSQVSSSIFEASSSNLAYAEKPIVAIPPHASKSFYEYIIMGDVIQNCSVRLKVKKNQPEGMTLTESETPLKFKNYITYRIGKSEEAKVVSNDFYISGFKNYLYLDIIKKEWLGCKKTVEINYIKESAPDRFYVKYDKSHKNHYSADAINKAMSSKVKKKIAPNGSPFYSVRKE